MIRELEVDGYHVRLDLSEQVLRIDVSEEVRFDGEAGTGEERIRPSLREALGDRFVPAAVLVQKAKQFDDGRYAAVEPISRHPRHGRNLCHLAPRPGRTPSGRSGR